MNPTIGDLIWNYFQTRQNYEWRVKTEEDNRHLQFAWENVQATEVALISEIKRLAQEPGNA